MAARAAESSCKAEGRPDIRGHHRLTSLLALTGAGGRFSVLGSIFI